MDTTPRIHWRFAAEGGRGLPAPGVCEGWLSADERSRLAALRVDKRRRDWLLGRLNAKALLVEMVQASVGDRLEPADLEIGRHPSGAPLVRLAVESRRTGTFEPGAPLPMVVSNTHSNRHAMFAAAWTGDRVPAGFTLGVDIEWVEPRSAAFVRDFLTPIERDFCELAGAERDLRANLVWSAKESVLKALRRGLTADTYWLTCLPASHVRDRESARLGPGPPLTAGDLVPPDEAWQSLAIGAFDPRLGVEGRSFAGLWRPLDGFVATLVVGW